MKGTLRYYSGWYLQSLKEATLALHDPWLAQVFQHLFLPDVPVVFVMIILGALAGGNMAARKDGSGGFARALEKRYLDLGGEIVYGSTVEKIFTTSVKRTLPGLNNFLMAGQWVVPGGGDIRTLVSGKHAAMLLCRRDGKRFGGASQAS